MRHRRHRTVLILVAGVAAWITWMAVDYLDPRSLDGPAEMLTASARRDRVSIGQRVRFARLSVDSVHRQNRMALARRNRMRGDTASRIVPDSTAPDDPVPEDSSAARCVRLLRLDDRLIRSLSREIDGTRTLLDEYERLSAAYEHEVASCNAVLHDCRRRRRRRRKRNRTFVAAAVVVTAIVLLD